jgi:hypothetical protein
MSIKSKADWIRGFLESLEYSDNISQKQIKVLKDKLNELLEEIDDNYDDEDDNDYPIIGTSSTNIKSKPIFDEDDDLPF